MKVVNITKVMIKLQFKLPQALISRGFTRRTVFHAPALQQKGISALSQDDGFMIFNLSNLAKRLFIFRCNTSLDSVSIFAGLKALTLHKSTDPVKIRSKNLLMIFFTHISSEICYIS